MKMSHAQFLELEVEHSQEPRNSMKKKCLGKFDQVQVLGCDFNSQEFLFFFFTEQDVRHKQGI